MPEGDYIENQDALPEISEAEVENQEEIMGERHEDEHSDPHPVRIRGAPVRFTDYYVPRSFVCVTNSLGPVDSSHLASSSGSTPKIPDDPET